MKWLVVAPPPSIRQFQRLRHPLFAGVVLIAVLILNSPLSRRSFAAGGPPPQGFNLISSAFGAGGFIPSRYTCSGENVSPELRWTAAPSGTRSFVLIMTDPDAPGGTFVHWVAFNLPPSERNLPVGIPKGDTIPTGGVQGSNSFDSTGYGGPCPPEGKPHHYFFRLYAIDTRLSLKAGANRREVEQAMTGHILAKAELMGLYGK